MRQWVKIITPNNRSQAVVGFCVLMLLITALNFTFHWLFFGMITWPYLVVVFNTFFVGAPFAFLTYLIGMLQVEKLRELSLRSRKDGLTGLNNRQTFMQLAQRRFDEERRGMFLLLDADHFKQVNDTYGHAVGDTCLVAIARHLQWNLRSNDVAGRIGGEEFAIFLSGVNIEQARVIGTRLTHPIPFRGKGQNKHLTVTLSVGGVLATPGATLDRLLIKADDALYAAKAGGRARLVILEADEAAQTDQVA